jgi:hypothetical protein
MQTGLCFQGYVSSILMLDTLEDKVSGEICTFVCQHTLPVIGIAILPGEQNPNWF